MKRQVQKHLEDSLDVLRAVAKNSALHATLAEAAAVTARAMKAGRKLLVAGNGGSAADAQHLAAEFACRLCKDRAAMRAIALTTDSSALTAIANDDGFDRIFERQVEALGQAGDVFLGISTSGNSPNVVRALELSRKLGMVTIGFSGETGGKMLPLCDYAILIPSRVTAHIQEAHLALEHVFCAMTEQIYFADETQAGAEKSAVATTASRAVAGRN